MTGALSGWDTFPKDTQNLDTLTAAASAMRVGNGIENAANPLAAHHFGGTVGQSVLRPGKSLFSMTIFLACVRNKVTSILFAVSVPGQEYMGSILGLF